MNDPEALTLNHFIIGRASSNLPPDIFADKEISSQKTDVRHKFYCDSRLESLVA